MHVFLSKQAYYDWFGYWKQQQDQLGYPRQGLVSKILVHRTWVELKFFSLIANYDLYDFNKYLGSAPTTYFYGRVGSLPHKSRKFLVVSGRVGSLFWSCFWSYFGRFFKWNFKRFLTVLRHIWQCFISYGPEQALECLLTRLKDDIKVLPVQIQYFSKTRLYSLRSLSPSVLKI